MQLLRGGQLKIAFWRRLHAPRLRRSSLVVQPNGSSPHFLHCHKSWTWWKQEKYYTGILLAYNLGSNYMSYYIQVVKHSATTLEHFLKSKSFKYWKIFNFAENSTKISIIGLKRKFISGAFWYLATSESWRNCHKKFPGFESKVQNYAPPKICRPGTKMALCCNKENIKLVKPQPLPGEYKRYTSKLKFLPLTMQPTGLSSITLERGTKHHMHFASKKWNKSELIC